MKNSDKHRSTKLKAKHPVFLPGIKMNVYNTEQIKALGGIDAFLSITLVAILTCQLAH